LLLFPYKTYILVSAEITEKKNEKKTLMPSGSAMAVEEEAFTEREELSECEVFKIGENKAEDDDKREKEEI
jgi:dihydrodipicolinate reductase